MNPLLTTTLTSSSARQNFIRHHPLHQQAILEREHKKEAQQNVQRTSPMCFNFRFMKGKIHIILLAIISLLTVYKLGGYAVGFARSYKYHSEYMKGSNPPRSTQLDAIKSIEQTKFESVYYSSVSQLAHQPNTNNGATNNAATGEKQQVFLLILIATSPHDEKHRKLRRSIRETWAACSSLKQQQTIVSYTQAKESTTDCKLLFFMGRTYKHDVDEMNMNEAKQFNDVLIGDFKDSYFNMTRKLLFTFNYVDQKFSANFILKTDDDVYMNIPRLLHLLQSKLQEE